MHQYWLINWNKCTTLMQGIYDRGSGRRGRRGKFGDSVHFAQFFGKLKSAFTKSSLLIYLKRRVTVCLSNAQIKQCHGSTTGNRIFKNTWSIRHTRGILPVFHVSAQPTLSTQKVASEQEEETRLQKLDIHKEDIIYNIQFIIL